jgi:hypothetical protein
MITVEAREPTLEEIAWWKARHRATPKRVVETILFFLMFPMGWGGIGLVAQFLLGLVGLNLAPYPVIVCVAFGAWLSLWLLWQGRKAPRTPAEPPTIEVIHVADPVLVEAEESKDEGPIYFFGVGDETILFACGQWMYDPHVYAPSGADPDQFPNSEFRLVREPESGTVLRIELLGRPIQPTQVHKAGTLAIPPLASGTRFKGSLDQLQDALYDADEDHVLRRPRRKKGS